MEMTLGHVPSGITLGVLKVKDGDAKGALQIAAELQRKHADNPAAFAFEGEVYLADEDLTRADSAYDKAVSLGQVKSHVLRSHRIKRQLGVAGAEQAAAGLPRGAPVG